MQQLPQDSCFCIAGTLQWHGRLAATRGIDTGVSENFELRITETSHFRKYESDLDFQKSPLAGKEMPSLSRRPGLALKRWQRHVSFYLLYLGVRGKASYCFLRRPEDKKHRLQSLQEMKAAQALGAAFVALLCSWM